MRVETSPTEWLDVAGQVLSIVSLPALVAVMACACYWAWVRRKRQPGPVDMRDGIPLHVREDELDWEKNQEGES